MPNSISQCESCIYAFKKDDVYCCKKKKILICTNEDGMHKIIATRSCDYVNHIEECELFKEKEPVHLVAA
ncbi:MAG: hypothetical protein ACMUJM_18155 [bacterium]